ncbi:MAG TPA: anti-sigma factor [Nocardioidaceae bacterium]|nr:anti-sigma factor [Nocardioidaceae bacterium]
MTDDELHSQAYLYAVGALEADEALTFQSHLTSCAECQREVSAMNEVTSQLADVVATEPPPALRSAVLAQIAGTAQDAPSTEPAVALPARGRHAGPAAAVEAQHHASVVPLRRPVRERVSLLVAAAAVLVAVGLGGWALNDRNDARDQASAAQSTADALTAILSAGDAETVSSTTQDGARMAVVRSPSRDVALLLASGLPTLPSDKTYQAWTIDGKGTPTSAGTFESNGGETAYQLPPAAVKTGTVAVTVEDAGGAKAPTTDPIVALGLS